MPSGQIRVAFTEWWIEHRILIYVLARITIAFSIFYTFFVIGGLWGYVAAAALVALGVLLALRARRW